MWNFPISPPQASNFAQGHDFVFALITALTVFFTAVVSLLVIFFAVRYRKGSKASRRNPINDSKPIEIIWTVPPLILGLIVFFLGAKLFVDMRTPPSDAMEIFVIGKKWMWHMQHPNGVRENNTLHVPLGKPIKLTMISQDVIHAVYIPAFRVQYMVVPGKYSSLWFTPTKTGKYPLFCNMYCGTQHSEMGGYVYVVEPKEYNEWLARGGDMKQTHKGSLAEQGRELYKKLNCANCHVEKDTERAPTLYGIAGTTRNLRNNGKAVADDDYLRESIMFKDRKFTAGYEDTMPSYRQLSEEEIRNLVEYMKSLGQAKASETAPVSANQIVSSTPTSTQQQRNTANP